MRIFALFLLLLTCATTQAQIPPAPTENPLAPAYYLAQPVAGGPNASRLTEGRRPTGFQPGDPLDSVRTYTTYRGPFGWNQQRHTLSMWVGTSGSYTVINVFAANEALVCASNYEPGVALFCFDKALVGKIPTFTRYVTLVTNDKNVFVLFSYNSPRFEQKTAMVTLNLKYEWAGMNQKTKSLLPCKTPGEVSIPLGTGSVWEVLYRPYSPQP